MEKVGILTTRSYPLLPRWACAIEKLEGVEPVFVFDKKNFSQRDQVIFSNRTRGAFDTDWDKIDLNSIETIEVPSHNSEDFCNWCLTEGIGLLVNGGTPRKLGARLLAALDQGVLNAHPGILPKYRGATCCEWALYNHDPVGVTAHFMDEGIDSGPILFSRELEIDPDMTYSAIRVALYKLAIATNIEAINQVVREFIKPESLPKQPSADIFKPIPGELLEEVIREYGE